MSSVLSFEGATCFRQRLVLSTLSGRPIKIAQIRSQSDDPGLCEYEVNLLKLFDLLTNGSQTVISDTGTCLVYKPGTILGGENLYFDCGLERGISYFAEAVMCLAPFGKNATHITLEGITNGLEDVSVDSLRTITLPVLRKFGLGENDEFSLKITKRGCPPLGGGQIVMECPIVKSLHAVEFLDIGKIKKIRGVAFTTRCSPQTSNRVVESARFLLNKYIPDVYIYTDHYKGSDSGNSPGFGVTLVSETTQGVFLSAESSASAGMTAEEVGDIASRKLLHEISNEGCVATCAQWLALLYMVLCPEDVSKIKIGQRLLPYSVELLRNIQRFFGVVYKVKADSDSGAIICTCVGAGFKNLAKKVA